jgi:hypothetical protein
MPTVITAPGTPDAGYEPHDDRRHHAPPGGRMRDSLFWELIMPEEELGFQAYLYLTDRGKAGFNVIVWGPEKEPLALVQKGGEIGPEADLDDFEFEGLRLRQPELRQTAVLEYADDSLSVCFDYTALHDAFSYRQNPDGLPAWFAVNRLEQTGSVTGFLEVGGRRIEWDRVGHRDHSWGRRDWGVPQHWKWLVAYTDDGERMLNAWIWIARGEWGVGGYVVRDGELVALERVRHHADYDPGMGQRRLEAELTDVRGQTTHLTMERFGIVKLPTGDKLGTILMEAACRATIDGRPAAGQFETHWQGAYIDHLAAAGVA